MAVAVVVAVGSAVALLAAAAYTEKDKKRARTAVVVATLDAWAMMARKVADPEKQNEQMGVVLAALNAVVGLAKTKEIADAQTAAVAAAVAKAIAATGSLSCVGWEEFAKLKAELYVVMAAQGPVLWTRVAGAALWGRVVKAVSAMAGAVVDNAEAAAFMEEHSATQEKEEEEEEYAYEEVVEVTKAVQEYAEAARLTGINLFRKGRYPEVRRVEHGELC